MSTDQKQDILETKINRLAFAAKQREKFSAEARDLHAERQAVVDAALEQWEQENPEKAKALKESQKRAEDWSQAYQERLKALDNLSFAPAEHLQGLNGVRWTHKPKVSIGGYYGRLNDLQPLFLAIATDRIEQMATGLVQWKPATEESGSLAGQYMLPEWFEGGVDLPIYVNTRWEVDVAFGGGILTECAPETDPELEEDEAGEDIPF